MRRTRPLALIVLAATVILAACGGSSGGSGGSTAKPAFLGTYPGIDPAEESIKKGFLQAADDLKVEAIFRTPPTFDVAGQANVTQSALSYPNLKGVAVVAADPNGLEGVVKQAKAQGLVIAQAAGCTPAATAPICIEAFPAGLGQKAGKYFGQFLGGSGDVVIGTGTLDNLNSKANQVAFTDYLAQNFPNIHVVQVIFGCDSPDGAPGCAQNALSSHPNLKGYYAIGGAASLGTDVFAKAGKHVIVGTLDDTPTTLNGVKGGTVTFTLVQPLVCDGYLMLLALYLQYQNHLVSTVKHYDLGSTYIDSSNVGTVVQAQQTTCDALVNDFKTRVFKPAS